MLEPTLNYVPCPDPSGGHRMAYWQWGDAQAGHVVVCVHGLSRQGRDFDVLAQALVGRAGHPLRVVCPDVVGRGRSDWLKDPMGYQIPNYAADMLALLAQLQRTGARRDAGLVRHQHGRPDRHGHLRHAQLPLPRARAPPGAQRRRAGDPVAGPAAHWHLPGQHRPFRHRAAGRRRDVGDFHQLRTAHAAAVAGLVAAMVRPLPEGGFTLHYDPAIAVPFRAADRGVRGAGRGGAVAAV